VAESTGEVLVLSFSKYNRVVRNEDRGDGSFAKGRGTRRAARQWLSGFCFSGAGHDKRKRESKQIAQLEQEQGHLRPRFLASRISS